MNKLLYFILLPTLLSTSLAYSAEPAINKKHATGSTEWYWQYVEKPLKTVLLSSNSDVHLSYEISECMFCSGEEDNCDENGIFPIDLVNEEPAIAVVCHKGAHNQRLQVFAPLRDDKKAVFIITGDYSITVKALINGLNVSYDRQSQNNTIKQFSERWPQ